MIAVGLVRRTRRCGRRVWLYAPEILLVVGLFALGAAVAWRWGL